MDLGAWGLDKLDWKFFAGIINIIIIDIILAGDNAVVIAMAVRSLPRSQRRWGLRQLEELETLFRLLRANLSITQIQQLRVILMEALNRWQIYVNSTQ